ncbi:glycine betaine ABC transporter substrate-binding protein [Hoeflea prorocentri]|uniref:Amino acid-binding protein n=1 Tax=Hoeflea prorocentri TaxID=1922333 RepID=A0A9X3UJ23_9HYPH|nr:glycine betaine ABC transporter substrate-binding protein [Hoeflea prorocentri]MCY6381547.1 amino acid-binding protein [Hoeflea prorocentri]MDA5399347.1 amino acid-binding protein [Hoeflea prorocentri]
MQSVKPMANRFLALGCAAVMSAYGSAALAADVVIGVPNWPSVQATAHVLKVALENNLDVEVELQDGSNKAVFEAIDAGTMHVHPEAWLPNLDHLKRQYVDGKKTIKLNPSGASGTQAMCVTKGTAERTGIKELKELRNPEMAKKFDTDGDGKGDIWIGADGWGSTPIEQVRAKSYGYDKTMTLKIMEEDAALAEVEKAVAEDKNIVFFCYTPHHMFVVNELVVLEEPAYDSTKWIIVQPSPTPGWFEKSSAGVAWDTANLNIGYAASLESDHPKVAAMLNNVSLDTDTLSAMTYALSVENKDPSEFAKAWVEENADTVSGWFQ